MSDIEKITEATNKIIELYTKNLVSCRINDYEDVTVYNQDGKQIAKAYTTHLESNGEEIDWEYILQVDNWNTWKATATRNSWQGRQPLENHIRYYRTNKRTNRTSHRLIKRSL